MVFYVYMLKCITPNVTKSYVGYTNNISLRLKKHGYKIGFTAKTHLYHYESFSSTSNNSKGGKLSPYIHYLNIRNHILILKKHSDLFNSSIVKSCLFFNSPNITLL